MSNSSEILKSNFSSSIRAMPGVKEWGFHTVILCFSGLLPGVLHRSVILGATLIEILHTTAHIFNAGHMT